MAAEDRTEERKGGVELKERDEQRLKKPRKYRVIILNDDFTPIEFVVGLVVNVFRKSHEDAARITLEVHQKGAAVAGIYTHEIAETKCAIALSYAAQNEHPLQLTMEPED